jgi:hypothetical protein
VGIPAIPRSTLKPAFSNSSASNAEDLYSIRPSSANPQILSLILIIRDSFLEIYSKAFSFALLTMLNT